MHDVPGRLRLLAPILLLLCIVLAPAGAGATGWDKADEERILDYAVSAAIGEDAVMTVTERITVLIANYRIRHGIFRLFPVRIQKGGELRHYTFDVVSFFKVGPKVSVSINALAH